MVTGALNGMRTIEVQCYSGYKADERPVRLKLDDAFVEIAEVEDRWYSPGMQFFRVRLANGDHYILRQQEAQNVWTVEGYRSGHQPAPVPSRID